MAQTHADFSLPNSIGDPLRKLLLQIDDHVKALTEVYQGPHTTRDFLVSTEGYWGVSEEVVPDPMRLRTELEWHLAAKPEFKAFSEALGTDRLTRNQVNTLAGPAGLPRFRIDAGLILRAIIARRTSRGQLCEISARDFAEQICTQLCHDFAGDRVRVKYQVVLENVLLDTTTIRLDESTAIHKFMDGQIAELWDKYRSFRESYVHFSARMMALHKLQAYAEFEVEVPKVLGDKDTDGPEGSRRNVYLETNEKFQALLGTLRLLSDEPVFPGASWTETNSLIYFGGRGFRVSEVREFDWNSYSIAEADAPQLRDIYQRVSRTMGQSVRPFAIAIRRINLASGRVQTEDKLIDAMIALEALLLYEIGNESDRGELRHRISVRAAHVLGGSPAEMLAKYQVVKRLYDLRSKIVHGSHLSLDDVEAANEGVSIARQIGLKCLKCYYEAPPAWDKWLFGEDDGS